MLLALVACGCENGKLRDSRADARSPTDGPWSGDALLTLDGSTSDARHDADGSDMPGATRIYWGAWISDNVDTAPFDYVTESDPGILGVFESRTGKPVSLLHFGAAWEDADGDPIPFSGVSAAISRARFHGAIAVVDWGSWRAGGGTEQADFELSRIADGEYDAYVRAWAADAKAYGSPFFLRFNPEMNGNWLPWGTKDDWNGNTEAEFVSAWRHVVDIFNDEEATNVTWVWCPNYVLSEDAEPLLEDLYPGDAYVDWTCLDGYNASSDRGDSWKTFTEVFTVAYDYLLAFAPSKPIMIGETGTSKDGGSKPEWITSLLTDELPNDFPRIKALAWFNWDIGDDEIDWPIEGNSFDIADGTPIDQDSIDAFAEGIASPYYAPNEFGELQALTKIEEP